MWSKIALKINGSLTFNHSHPVAKISCVSNPVVYRADFLRIRKQNQYNKQSIFNKDVRVIIMQKEIFNYAILKLCSNTL